MADHNGQPRRRRARLACISCNSRRVKCDVIESQPCTNCIANHVPCETRESRRGKHPRRARILIHEHQVLLDSPYNPTDNITLSPEDATLQRHEDEVAASHVLASLSTSFNDLAGEKPASAHTLSPGLLSLAPQGQTHTTSFPTTESTDHEDDSAVFLGESSSLRYVPNEQKSELPNPKRPRFRHSIANAKEMGSLMASWEVERRKKRIESLHQDGAFVFPQASLREELLNAYFQWFHPHFSIVDELDIREAHSKKSLSPLLLQAMLFIGAIHCDENVLRNLRLGNRHRAKFIFFSKAKDVYDADHETKKLTIIQALFLLSFWRANALAEKDVRHWIGAAINLAQTKALHRSTGDIEPSIASLHRRIWWAIYVRERQAAAALGLPCRIRDEDCDVGFLKTTDFQSAFSSSTSTTKQEHYIQYSMAISDLARTLGTIVDAGYLPNRCLGMDERAKIRNGLYRWKQRLPTSMQLSNDGGETYNVQANMLHLAYNNLLILLHRSSFVTPENNNEDADGNIALQAAARNSRIVEDMLSDDSMRHAQIHVITNLFNTLCIHVVHLRCSSGINRTITEHRAKVCLMGLKELQKTWEVTNWVLQLFFQYLDRSTADRLVVEVDDTRGSIMATRQNTSSPELIRSHQLASSSLHTDVSTMQSADLDNAESTTNHDGTTLHTSTTPWSWTTDEANNYLFSQIENEFAFGEGGMLEWSPDELFPCSSNDLPDLGYDELDTMP
ncbi:fungal-specific transcription factor domain-containing protein [Dendryphion nanum]|uniref:Fungal-specific transcription factor domain-containing protein n=1 Tax=Dendryphion nanum TaxID=256645 RepID=A0A9P9I9N9_9PLEO|nr:fungal-specific transcription factor domain-containing protein [Dendryphion nanum]